MTSLSPNPSPFSVDNVTKVCERLGTLEIRRALNNMFKGTQVPYELSAGMALRVWFKDLLKILPLDHEQRELVYDELADQVEKFGGELFETMADGREILLVRMFGLADRRYVTMTGMKHMLDVETGDRIQGLTLQFLETVQYNLTTLFARRYMKCTQGGQDVPPKVSAVAEG